MQGSGSSVLPPGSLCPPLRPSSAPSFRGWTMALSPLPETDDLREQIVKVYTIYGCATASTVVTALGFFAFIFLVCSVFISVCIVPLSNEETGFCP